VLVYIDVHGLSHTERSLKRTAKGMDQGTYPVLCLSHHFGAIYGHHSAGSPPSSLKCKISEPSLLEEQMQERPRSCNEFAILSAVVTDRVGREGAWRVLPFR
jgi:hypothetical protein